MAKAKNDGDTASTRESILSAAELAFAERGLRGARLADIAATVGIRRPSLLYHFPSKAALYSAVIDRAFDDVGEALVSAARPGETGIQDVVDALDGFTARRQAVIAVVLRAWVDPSDEEHRRVATSMNAFVDALAVVIASLTRTTLPVRSALMYLVTGHMVRCSAGDRTQARWPREDLSKLAGELFR